MTVTDEPSYEVVFRDPDIPADRLMFEGIDPDGSPQFRVSEVARVFFARSSHWVRYCENENFFTLDGEVVATRRTPEGARTYNLLDIEKMAHALAQNDRIDGETLHRVLSIIRLVGEVHKVPAAEGF